MLAVVVAFIGVLSALAGVLSWPRGALAGILGFIIHRRSLGWTIRFAIS